MDIFQREMEYDYICRYLEPHMRVLEVGCGNGFSTERFRALVVHVDAFDYAEKMIERARERVRGDEQPLHPRQRARARAARRARTTRSCASAS